jgi:hypothetical protein
MRIVRGGVAPMEIGSTVSVEVEGLGVLTNPLVAEPADS